MKIQVSNQSKYDPKRSIELANLIERAYQQFDYHQRRRAALQTGVTLPTWRESLQHQLFGSTVVQPQLSGVGQPHELDQVTNPGRVEYKILATFSYTGYWVGKPGKVPFGFIAQRPLEDGTPGIFIVFRGTRDEPEWVSNFQYAQVPFLNQVIDRPKLGVVSRGFNKIYTRPHPDEVKQMHEQFSDDQVFEGSVRDGIFETLKTCPVNAQLYLTGHSLGAALATLATLDICQHTDFSSPILYTFASPRVGDPNFASLLQNLSCFRITNSEDIVPTVPPPSGRLIGEEMFDGLTPARRSTLEFLLQAGRKVADAILNTEHVYQHVGEPLYFTDQRGSISLNHNMFLTYREALPEG